MLGNTDALVLAGGFAGGLVSGLAGFGTGLSALPFWLLALPPSVAAPLVVICSLIAQILTLPAIRHAIRVVQVVPMLIGGLIGVPLGAVLLPHVPADGFRVAVGTLLVAYAGIALAARRLPLVGKDSRTAETLVGVAAGVFGGLAGLSGPLPTIWATLRRWEKDRRRALFQVFNTAILTLALAAQAAAGLLDSRIAQLALLALPATVAGTWLGRLAYGRLSTPAFDRAILALLLTAGVLLIASTRR